MLINFYMTQLFIKDELKVRLGIIRDRTRVCLSVNAMFNN